MNICEIIDQNSNNNNETTTTTNNEIKTTNNTTTTINNNLNDNNNNIDNNNVTNENENDENQAAPTTTTINDENTKQQIIIDDLTTVTVCVNDDRNENAENYDNNTKQQQQQQLQLNTNNSNICDNNNLDSCDNKNNDDDDDCELTSLLHDDSQSTTGVTNNSYHDDFDSLSTLDKFFRLCDTQKLDIAIKYIQPALDSCKTYDEFMKVFANLRNSCLYNDVIIRSIWIEQIPNVVQYIDNKNYLNENLRTEISIILSNLIQFTSYQVRKIASSALLTLIERNLIEISKIEQHIIPCLLNLINENNDDIHIECVSIFGKLAPLIGRELTVKHLLIPFCRLCSSPVFHTRKVCATNIGEIAVVISTQEVEEFLLPLFNEFTKDQVWAIRKVCAEIFATFANKCSRKVRESELTESFIRLLEDNSRWVKISAYKTLGSFIATFFQDDIEQPQQQQQNENNSTSSTTTDSSGSSSRNNLIIKLEDDESDNKKLIKNEKSKLNDKNNNNSDNNDKLLLLIDNDANQQYTNFLYWRNNLPDIIEDDADLVEEEEGVNTRKLINSTNNDNNSNTSSSSSNTADNSDNNENDDSTDNNSSTMSNNNNNSSGTTNTAAATTTATTSDDDDDKKLKIEINDEQENEINANESEIQSLFEDHMAAVNKNYQQYSIFNDYLPSNQSQFQQHHHHHHHHHHQQQQQQQQPHLFTSFNLSSELKEQNIVPSKLLGYYITMVDMNAQTSLDSEMNYNCAFNFPAILHTLGASYWKYLKNLYKKLAEDVNWKVRQTLAYSIHELASILGTEITQADLVPIFDSYIKDVDEVRIGIVTHLSKFLKCLNMEYRQQYMPKLNDFLKMDNQRNWRFRNELGSQIAEFCELYPCDCIAKFIQPITFTLCLDKVAQVRLTALNALTQILRQFVINNEQQLRKNFIEDVIRTFAKSDKWSFRQLFVLLCLNIIEQINDDSCIEFYIKELMPLLLQFRYDKVPNIRICLARFISTITNDDNYHVLNKSYESEISVTVQYLKNDTDKDVKYYFLINNNNNNNSDSSNNNGNTNNKQQLILNSQTNTNTSTTNNNSSNNEFENSKTTSITININDNTSITN